MAKIALMLNRSYRKNLPKEFSKIYKKWFRYLKNKKLYDEFMIYMDAKYGNTVGTYPSPMNYDELELLTSALQKRGLIGGVGKSYINVNWYEEFLQFAKETLPWWNFYRKNKYFWKIFGS